jgi:stage V sporulation protein R
MTKELVEDLVLYLFEKKGQEWKITDKGWENVRDQLILSRINGGFPHLFIDGNYMNNGELFIQHSYEGVELDIKYLERTMPYVYQTVGESRAFEDKDVVFTYDGNKSHRKFL